MNIKSRCSRRVRPHSYSLGQFPLDIPMYMMDQLTGAKQNTPLQMKLLYVLDLQTRRVIWVAEGRIKLWSNRIKWWPRKMAEEEEKGEVTWSQLRYIWLRWVHSRSGVSCRPRPNAIGKVRVCCLIYHRLILKQHAKQQLVYLLWVSNQDLSKILLCHPYTMPIAANHAHK